MLRNKDSGELHMIDIVRDRAISAASEASEDKEKHVSLIHHPSSKTMFLAS